MILSRDFNDINSIYDFSEGIICDICWDDNLTDLLVTVYYYFDEPRDIKNKDVIIRFKKCSTVNFDCGNMLASMKEYNIVAPHPTIEHFLLKKNSFSVIVEIATNYASPMISLMCDEIWVESIDEIKA